MSYEINSYESYLAVLNFLMKAHTAYYVRGEPTISDDEYDDKIRGVLAYEKANPDEIEPYSPTQIVGSNLTGKLPSVKHKTPMLSLDNMFNESDLTGFFTYLVEAHPSETLPLIVGELKYDGVASEVHYIDGVFDHAVTRGDGENGEDITAHVRTIKTIPKKIPVSGHYSVRGEVIMPYSSFNEYNEANPKDPFANCRNAVVGTLGLNDLQECANRKLDFYPYGAEYHSWEPTLLGSNQDETLHMLHIWGFRNARTWGIHSLQDALDFVSEGQQIRENPDREFDIDGVVFKVRLHVNRDFYGETSRAPRWAKAYKFPAEQKDTDLDRVEFQVGRTGAVTPVAKVKPVRCGGVVISSVTLHNADELERLGLYEGCTVRVQRAGDVIPQIVKVVENSEHMVKTPVLMPTCCPSCESKLVRVDATTMCINSICPAQLQRSIEHFVSKPCFDIDGMGGKTVAKFIEKGLIKSPASIFGLTEDLLKTVISAAATKKLLAAIENSKAISPERFIFAMGIPDVGEGTAKRLCASFDSIPLMMNRKAEDFMVIKDIGELTAKSLENWFGNADNQLLIEILYTFGVHHPVKQAVTGGVLAGQKWCVTGTLSKGRTEMQAMLKNLGAEIVSSVNKDTNGLLVGEKAGSKLTKAMALGLTIWTEDHLNNAIK